MKKMDFQGLPLKNVEFLVKFLTKNISWNRNERYTSEFYFFDGSKNSPPQPLQQFFGQIHFLSGIFRSFWWKNPILDQKSAILALKSDVIPEPFKVNKVWPHKTELAMVCLIVGAWFESNPNTFAISCFALWTGLEKNMKLQKCSDLIQTMLKRSGIPFIVRFCVVTLYFRLTVQELRHF